VLIGSFLKKKEMKNAGWIIAGKATQMVLAFAVSIFSTRYLGPDNYGLINYAEAYVAFFSAICSLGINSVIIKDFLEDPENVGKALGTTIVLRAAAGILSAVMMASFISFADAGEPVTMGVGILCSLALISQAFDTFNYWFQSRYQSKVSVIATLAAYVLTCGYKVYLLVSGKNVFWFAFSTSVDYVISGLVLYFMYRRNHGPILRFSWEKGKQLLKISYHYILSGMMVAIYGQTDKLMLKQMLNESSVGQYSLATTINSMWVFVLYAVIDSMYPTIVRLYSTDKAAFEKKNRQLYAIVIYASLTVSIGFLVFGRVLVRIVYGDAFLPAADILNVVTWYTMFSFLGVARNAWIVCENKQKYLKYMYLAAALLNVLINWLLIPRAGAMGAAAASLITQIATSLLLPMLIKDLRPNVKLIFEGLCLKDVF